MAILRSPISPSTRRDQALSMPLRVAREMPKVRMTCDALFEDSEA